MKRFIFISTFLMFSTSLLTAQRFIARGYAGLALSQMEGDALAGFDKGGLTAGIQVQALLTEKLALGMEVGYIQKGSRQGALDIMLFSTDAKTSLNYAQIPVFLEFKDWYIRDKEYYKMAGHLGMSYDFLISSESDNPIINPFVSEYSNDVSFIAGGTFFFTKRLGLTIRYSRAVTQMYQDEQLTTGGLRNYLWSVRGEFAF